MGGMADLHTTYMGLPLTSPLIVSSSSLTQTAEKVQQCEAAGAGAVVLKSLFEEQIEADIDAGSGGTEHTEAMDYLRQMQTDAGMTAYTRLVAQAKGAVSIPVIASINAVSRDWWEDHVTALQDAGADALELNIALMPAEYTRREEQIQQFYVDVVTAVCKQVSIPVAVKIGPQFTSLPAMVDALAWAGASAVVLFNRFYQFDINIEKMLLTSASPFSTSADLAAPLRWISLIAGKGKAELAASSGVHTGADAIKTILAGAQAVQVCSALYRNGVNHLESIRKDMESWMDRHSFTDIAQFRGKLSHKKSETPAEFERIQYIKALVGVE